MQTTPSALVDAYSVESADPAEHFGEVHGLPLSITGTVGVIETVDGSQRWNFMRTFFPDKTRTFRPIGGPVGGDLDLTTDPDLAYAGPVISGQRDGRWGYWRPDGTPMLDLDDKRAHLIEGDLIDLTAERVSAGWRIHARHPEHPLAYASWAHQVRGRFCGHEVTGVMSLDAVHMPADKGLYPSPYLDELEIAFGYFANELVDGTWETGTLLVGAQGYQALVVNHGDTPVVVTSTTGGSVEFDGIGEEYPTRVTVEGDGETVTFEAEPAGRWPLMAHVPGQHRLRVGTVHRAGCPVPVRRSYACLEAFRDRV